MAWLTIVTHSEPIREKIKEQQQISQSVKRTAEQIENDEPTIKLEPIGLDRDKKRIWSLDGELPFSAADPRLGTAISFREPFQASMSSGCYYHYPRRA